MTYHKKAVKSRRLLVNLWKRGMDLSTSEALNLEIKKLAKKRVHFYISGRRARDCKKLLKRELDLLVASYLFF